MAFFTGGGTSTQTNAPWGPMQPFLLNAAGATQNLYNQGLPGMWSGQYLPDQSPQTTGAVQGITNITNSGVPQGVIQAGANAAQNLASGTSPGQQYLQNVLNTGGAGMQYAQGLPGQMGTGNAAQAAAQNAMVPIASGQNLAQNPYLNSMYQQASTPLIQQWQNQVAPGISAMFSAAGRFGGAADPNRAMGATTNQSLTSLGNALGTLGSNLYGNAYGQGLNQQTNILNSLANLGTTQSGQQINLGSLFGQLQGQNTNAAQAMNQAQLGGATALPNMANAMYSPYAALGAAGQTMDAFNTANQTYRENLYNYMNGGGAWQNLNQYINALHNNPASMVTQQTTTAPSTTGMQQVISGLQAGGALANMVGNSGQSVGNFFSGLFGGGSSGIADPGASAVGGAATSAGGGLLQDLGFYNPLQEIV